MNAALEGAAWRHALRAVYKSHPTQHVEVVQQGPVEITTTRPSFWHDEPDQLTWGDHLNALVIRIAADSHDQRATRRILDEACADAERAFEAADAERREAAAAWEANRTPENAVALAEAVDACSAAAQGRDHATRTRRSHWGHRLESEQELLRFLDNIAFAVADIDLQSEYSCGECG